MMVTMRLSKTKGRKLAKAQVADDLKFKKCKTTSDTIKAARARAAQTGDNPVLAEHAAVIRRLGKRVLVDTIEIGKRLTEAKKIVGHGKWAEWLKKEFGWSADTALNFMRIFAESKSRNFRDLDIAPSALYLLVKPSTPEAVRDEVLDRAEAGEVFTLKDVKKAVKEPEPGDEPESGSEPEASGAEPESPTNDWRADLMRGLRGALTLAGECVEYGEQTRGVISDELRQQMREVFAPHRRAVSEAKNKAQGFVDYLDLILSITEPEAVAEVAE